MKDASYKSLSETDRASAMESLRQLVSGVPIRDEDNSVIGWIEKPSLEAVKFVLNATEAISENNGYEWG